MTEPVKVIADILQSELELETGRVRLENQRLNVATAGLTIVVGYVSGKPIGNNNYSVSDGDGPDDGMTEVQELTMHHLVQIDAMSFDDTARRRLPEILQALASIKAQQSMGTNLMNISRIPASGFLNVSALEETAMLNRYTITVAVTALHRKEKMAPYYDQFPNPEVHVNA